MRIRSEQTDLVKFLRRILDEGIENKPMLHFYDGKCFVRGDDVAALVEFYEGDFEGSLLAEPILRILDFGFSQVEINKKEGGGFEILLAGEGVGGGFAGAVYGPEKWNIPTDIDFRSFKGVDLDKGIIKMIASVFADSRGDAINFIGLSSSGDIFAADALRFLLKGDLKEKMVFFPLTICDLVLSLPQDVKLSYLHYNGTYFFNDRRGLLFQVAYRYTDEIVDRVRNKFSEWMKEFKEVAAVDGKMLARSLRLVCGVDEIAVCTLVLDSGRINVKGLSGGLNLQADVKKKNTSISVRTNIGILEFLEAAPGKVSIEIKDNIICFNTGECKLVTAMAG